MKKEPMFFNNSRLQIFSGNKDTYETAIFQNVLKELIEELFTRGRRCFSLMMEFLLSWDGDY
jgi:hypothetical protein